jgi:hypothetical protein
MKSEHDMNKNLSASSAPGEGPTAHAGHETHGAHSGHSWMMMACCVPMLLIVVVLVATGVASAGLFLWAALCIGMMAMMMKMMGHGDGGM